VCFALNTDKYRVRQKIPAHFKALQPSLIPRVPYNKNKNTTINKDDLFKNQVTLNLFTAVKYSV